MLLKDVSSDSESAIRPAGLGARDIMGYCLLCLVFSGVVIAGGLYFLT